MSSHTLDLSGQRALSITINDPAVSKVWAPAKQGDDADLSFSGREIRIALSPTARIQVRRVPVKKQQHHEGHPVKENGEFVYDDAVEERLVLVLSGSASGFIRASLTPDQRTLPDGTEGKPTFEQYTHTSVVAKRRGDDEWHYLEAGDLAAEYTLADVLGTTEG